MRVGAIVVAGGSGSRLGAQRPKAFVDLDGETMLARAVAAVTGSGLVGTVVVVVPAEEIPAARGLVEPAVGERAGFAIVAGGRERQDSVRNGLAALPPIVDLVVVHDAARPLATPALVAACIRTAAEKGAAVAALPVEDTIKRVDDGGRVTATLDRAALVRVQTPQAFRRALLERAHARALAENVRATDDAALVERDGGTVWIVPGEARNRKITTAEDLSWARWVVAAAREPR